MFAVVTVLLGACTGGGGGGTASGSGPQRDGGASTTRQVSGSGGTDADTDPQPHTATSTSSAPAEDHHPDPATSTSPDEANPAETICDAPTMLCTDRDEGAAWWSRVGEPYFHPDPAAWGLVETVIVFNKDGKGFDADPSSIGTLLIVMYTTPETRPDQVTSSEPIFAAGGFVVQHRIGAPRNFHVPEDNDTSDDGYARRLTRVHGRPALLEEFTEPPTGINGFTLTWQIPLDDNTAQIMELFVDSTVIDERTLLTFAEQLEAA